MVGRQNRPVTGDLPGTIERYHGTLFSNVMLDFDGIDTLGFNNDVTNCWNTSRRIGII